eukprot:TRINITY_DN13578_c0_g1_i2.p1 TRINITY_DN13578_c0_g1~~TRINITY_DN13578_c0_g1_i2.p1  ORF type:complete len:2448 (+),score=611.60 TRINITY_DN13578_c0_g1_i2:548-7345(+)
MEETSQKIKGFLMYTKSKECAEKLQRVVNKYSRWEMQQRSSFSDPNDTLIALRHIEHSLDHWHYEAYEGMQNSLFYSLQNDTQRKGDTVEFERLERCQLQDDEVEQTNQKQQLGQFEEEALSRGEAQGQLEILVLRTKAYLVRLQENIKQAIERQTALREAYHAYETEMYELRRKHQAMTMQINEMKERRKEEMDKRRAELEHLRSELAGLKRSFHSLQMLYSEDTSRCMEVESRIHAKLENRCVLNLSAMAALRQQKAAKDRDFAMRMRELKKVMLESEIEGLKQKLQDRKAKYEEDKVESNLRRARALAMEARSVIFQFRVRVDEVNRQRGGVKDAEAIRKMWKHDRDPVRTGTLAFLAKELGMHRQWLQERQHEVQICHETLVMKSSLSMGTPLTLLQVCEELLFQREAKLSVIRNMAFNKYRTHENKAKGVTNVFTKLKGFKDKNFAAVGRVPSVQEVQTAVHAVLLREYDDLLRDGGSEDLDEDSERGAELSEKFESDPEAVRQLWHSVHGLKQTKKSQEHLAAHFERLQEYLANTGMDRTMLFFGEKMEDLSTAVKIACTSARWLQQGFRASGMFKDVLWKTLRWLPRLADKLAERCGMLQAAAKLIQEASSREEEEEQRQRTSQILAKFLNELRPLSTDQLQEASEAWVLRVQQGLRKRLDIQDAAQEVYEYYHDQIRIERKGWQSVGPELQAVANATKALSILLKDEELAQVKALEKLSSAEITSLLSSTTKRLLMQAPPAFRVAGLTIFDLDHITSSAEQDTFYFSDDEDEEKKGDIPVEEGEDEGRKTAEEEIMQDAQEFLLSSAGGEGLISSASHEEFASASRSPSVHGTSTPRGSAADSSATWDRQHSSATEGSLVADPILELDQGSEASRAASNAASALVGSLGGTRPASIAGSRPGSVAGSRSGSVAGSRPGSVVAGSQPGSVVASSPQPGSVAAGSLPGSRPGSVAGSRPGSVAGSHPAALIGADFQEWGFAKGTPAGSPIPEENMLMFDRPQHTPEDRPTTQGSTRLPSSQGTRPSSSILRASRIFSRPGSSETGQGQQHLDEALLEEVLQEQPELAELVEDLEKLEVLEEGDQQLLDLQLQQEEQQEALKADLEELLAELSGDLTEEERKQEEAEAAALEASRRRLGEDAEDKVEGLLHRISKLQKTSGFASTARASLDIATQHTQDGGGKDEPEEEKQKEKQEARMSEEMKALMGQAREAGRKSAVDEFMNIIKLREEEERRELEAEARRQEEMAAKAAKAAEAAKKALERQEKFERLNARMRAIAELDEQQEKLVKVHDEHARQISNDRISSATAKSVASEEEAPKDQAPEDQLQAHETGEEDLDMGLDSMIAMAKKRRSTQMKTTRLGMQMRARSALKQQLASKLTEVSQNFGESGKSLIDVTTLRRRASPEEKHTSTVTAEERLAVRTYILDVAARGAEASQTRHTLFFRAGAQKLCSSLWYRVACRSHPHAQEYRVASRSHPRAQEEAFVHLPQDVSAERPPEKKAVAAPKKTAGRSQKLKETGRSQNGPEHQAHDALKPRPGSLCRHQTSQQQNEDRGKRASGVLHKRQSSPHRPAAPAETEKAVDFQVNLNFSKRHSEEEAFKAKLRAARRGSVVPPPAHRVSAVQRASTVTKQRVSGTQMAELDNSDVLGLIGVVSSSFQTQRQVTVSSASSSDSSSSSGDEMVSSRPSEQSRRSLGPTAKAINKVRTSFGEDPASLADLLDVHTVKEEEEAKNEMLAGSDWVDSWIGESEGSAEKNQQLENLSHVFVPLGAAAMLGVDEFDEGSLVSTNSGTPDPEDSTPELMAGQHKLDALFQAEAAMRKQAAEEEAAERSKRKAAHLENETSDHHLKKGVAHAEELKNKKKQEQEENAKGLHSLVGGLIKAPPPKDAGAQVKKKTKKLQQTAMRCLNPLQKMKALTSGRHAEKMLGTSAAGHIQAGAPVLQLSSLDATDASRQSLMEASRSLYEEDTKLSARFVFEDVSGESEWSGGRKHQSRSTDLPLGHSLVDSEGLRAEDSIMSAASGDTDDRYAYLRKDAIQKSIGFHLSPRTGMLGPEPLPPLVQVRQDGTGDTAAAKFADMGLEATTSAALLQLERVARHPERLLQPESASFSLRLDQRPGTSPVQGGARSSSSRPATTPRRYRFPGGDDPAEGNVEAALVKPELHCGTVLGSPGGYTTSLGKRVAAKSRIPPGTVLKTWPRGITSTSGGTRDATLPGSMNERSMYMGGLSRPTGGLDGSTLARFKEPTRAEAARYKSRQP